MQPPHHPSFSTLSSFTALVFFCVSVLQLIFLSSFGGNRYWIRIKKSQKGTPGDRYAGSHYFITHSAASDCGLWRWGFWVFFGYIDVILLCVLNSVIIFNDYFKILVKISNSGFFFRFSAKNTTGSARNRRFFWRKFPIYRRFIGESDIINCTTQCNYKLTYIFTVFCFFPKRGNWFSDICSEQ